MEVVTSSAVTGTIVINLGSESNFAMIAAIASALAAVASCVLIILQIKESRKQKRQDNLAEVLSNIISQRQHFYTTLEALYKWKKTDSNWDYIFKGILKALLNSYEYACGMYCENKLDKELFKAMFKDEVIGIYEDDIGKDYDLSVREENSEIYSCIRKVAKEFKNLLPN